MLRNSEICSKNAKRLFFLDIVAKLIYYKDQKCIFLKNTVLLFLASMLRNTSE